MGDRVLVEKVISGRPINPYPVHTSRPADTDGQGQQVAQRRNFCPNAMFTIMPKIITVVPFFNFQPGPFFIIRHRPATRICDVHYRLKEFSPGRLCRLFLRPAAPHAFHCRRPQGKRIYGFTGISGHDVPSEVALGQQDFSL